MTHISKEQDYESDLADHGVRKYDYDIGRFTSTDVLFEKYYGWSPYQYSANNPINMLDWNGRFPIPTHIEVETKYGGKNELFSSLYNIYCDIFQMNDNSVHLDNIDKEINGKTPFQQINKIIDDAGGFMNMEDHTIGDFFSHSNYVDIWKGLSDAGKVSGDMPLWDAIDWEGAFGQALKSDLKTTAYPDKGQINGHNGGSIEKGGFRSKDKGSDIEYYNQVYELALKGFEKSIYEKYNSNNSSDK